MINLIKNEIHKTFKSKKLYLFMLIIVGIEVSAVLQYKLRGPDYVFITANGQSFPLNILGGIPQLLIIFIAVFVAEIIAEEYRNGTLKLPLLRPILRIKLLNSKIVALFIFISTLLLFTIASSYVVGTLAFGWGNQIYINGVAYTTGKGILLTLQSALISTLPAMGFGLIVVFLATLSTSIAITIGIPLGLMMISPFIDHIDQLKNYSIVYQMYNFHQNFIKNFIWENVVIGILCIAAYIVIFYVGSFLAFRRKDILL